MDDLPELPFEKLLSYLSLRDRLKLSAVSRSCHQKVINSRVRTLCYSDRPRDFIRGKNRWVSGTFAENFISSTRFESFFNAFGRSVLSSLKHLRLCDLSLDLENQTAFTRTLKSFNQLEELDIIRAKCSKERQFKLTLPRLTSIHLEELSGFKKLILDAQSLRKVKILSCFDLRLHLIHGESVEKLLVDRLECTDVKNLKNLKCLHTGYYSTIDPTLLSGLEQLNEVYTTHPIEAPKIFELKERRAGLKIYLWGLLLNGLGDPAMNNLEALFRCSTENPSRLADEIPLCSYVYYRVIESVPRSVTVLKRYVDLIQIRVNQPVQDIQRFLNLLKNLNIVQLCLYCAQPQDLFDRLPEYSAIQQLAISAAPADHQFLFRLKHLIQLNLNYPLGRDFVRKILNQLPFLALFKSQCNSKNIQIEISRQKKFSIFLDGEWTEGLDLNSVIQHFVDRAPQNKRKAEHLE